jgi:hypothetical protein
MGIGPRVSWIGAAFALVAILCQASSCTLYHSKIPITDIEDAEISKDSVFVTEDDSGLALLGIFVVSEPDHYSVLVERARRRYKCERLHHVQLDFYSDYWLFVGFPIARITAICEPIKAEGEGDTESPAERPETPDPVPSKPVSPPVPAPAPDPIPPVQPLPATTPDAAPDSTGPG